MASKVEDELAQMRAELEALRPKAPTGPVFTGSHVDVVFGETRWWTSDHRRVVPDGDPEAAHLAGRGGLVVPIDAGALSWLEALGEPVERVRG